MRNPGKLVTPAPAPAGGLGPGVPDARRTTCGSTWRSPAQARARPGPARATSSPRPGWATASSPRTEIRTRYRHDAASLDPPRSVPAPGAWLGGWWVLVATAGTAVLAAWCDPEGGAQLSGDSPSSPWSSSRSPSEARPRIAAWSRLPRVQLFFDRAVRDVPCARRQDVLVLFVSSACRMLISARRNSEVAGGRRRRRERTSCSGSSSTSADTYGASSEDGELRNGAAGWWSTDSGSGRVHC